MAKKITCLLNQLLYTLKTKLSIFFIKLLLNGWAQRDIVLLLKRNYLLEKITINLFYGIIMTLQRQASLRLCFSLMSALRQLKLFEEWKF